MEPYLIETLTPLCETLKFLGKKDLASIIIRMCNKLQELRYYSDYDLRTK